MSHSFSSNFDGLPEVEPQIDEGPPLGSIIAERWELVDHLGEGGMSNVFKAKHVIMQKYGAVKFLKADLAQDPVAVKRFQQEAQTAGTLSHPNIVQMYDCGLCEYGVYLIMEVLPGVSLFEIMQKRAEHAYDGLGTFELEEALPIFLQICDGLEHAHKKGIIHRDIKPSNIMLLEQEDPEADNPEQLVVKLVDFGLAKMVGVDGTTGGGKLTITGEVYGSPVYMSPEHCLGNSLDGRSDMYSLGCMMYECMTGRKVLLGHTSTQTMLRHVEEDADLRGLTELKDPHSRQIGVIIQRCLQRDPDRRYHDMGELRAELKELETACAKKKRSMARAGIRPLTYIMAAAALIAAPVLAVALYSFWPLPSAPVPDSKPIAMPVKAPPARKNLVNAMSPKLFSGGEGVVAHLDVPVESKAASCAAVLKRADQDLALKQYDDARHRFDFVYKYLSDSPQYLPVFADLKLKARIGQVVAESDMKDLDALDIGLGNVIKSQSAFYNASNEAKRYALQWRARVQNDNGSYAAAAATIRQMLELYPDFAAGANPADPDDIVQKALWTGLLADLLRLTDDKGKQSQGMFEDFDAAQAALKTAAISDADYAEQVRAFRGRLYYRQGKALEQEHKFPEAFRAFQESLEVLAGQGRFPEVEASRVQSYIALRQYDWFESLKYRLQNHL